MTMRRLLLLCGALGAVFCFGSTAVAQLHPDYVLTVRRAKVRMPQSSRRVRYKKPSCSRLPDTTYRLDVRLPNKRTPSVSRQVKSYTQHVGRRVRYKQPLSTQFEAVKED